MDVASVDVIWNGFHQAKKIADLAETFEVNCAPHNYYSHLATFIAAQWCAAIPNARILEYDVDDVPWRDELVTVLPEISAGELRIPTGPGWGVELNEDVLRAHPWPTFLGRLERGIESRRGAALLFLVALAVYGLQSIALPVVPGRDFGTYLRFYVQMFEWDSVLPMSMLFRTPLAPLVVGGSLDLLGGYATQALMAVLYATSIVCWTRTALAFGGRAALVTAVVLLLYPGYGILFHMLSSDSICAFVFAVWALALTRASLEPTTGRFALLGLATAAAALTRPGYQVLAVFALVPLVLRLTWRRRLAASASFLGVVVGLLGVWTVNNGVRYDDYALARGGGAFFPFYRAFTTDRIVSPENGEASRELADAIRTDLLDEEPYRSYGITLERFFEGGGPREFEDVVGITDRVWGWETDYAQMREVGRRGGQDTPLAVRAGRDRHRPRRALESSARCASSARTPARRRRSTRTVRARSTGSRLHPRGSRSRRLGRGSSRRRRTARSRRYGRLRRTMRWSSRPPKRSAASRSSKQRAAA